MATGSTMCTSPQSPLPSEAGFAVAGPGLLRQIAQYSPRPTFFAVGTWKSRAAGGRTGRLATSSFVPTPTLCAISTTTSRWSCWGKWSYQRIPMFGGAPRQTNPRQTVPHTTVLRVSLPWQAPPVPPCPALAHTGHHIPKRRPQPT